MEHAGPKAVKQVVGLSGAKQLSNFKLDYELAQPNTGGSARRRHDAPAGFCLGWWLAALESRTTERHV